MKENDTTLTPLWLIDALGGPFDTDPCAYEGHYTAHKRIVWPDDGLRAEWHGRVWCNPPYSDPRPWMRRMAEHGNGIALVLASTDTAWFQELAESKPTFLFLKGRPKFHRKDMSLVSLMRANVLIGWGEAGEILKTKPVDGFVC